VEAFFQSPSYSLIYTTQPMTLEPGHYTATYFLKVADNAIESSVANIYGGIDFSMANWTSLGNASIRHTDFVAAGKYQGFNFEFTLDELTPEVELRIDYGEGGADLWVDYLLLESDHEDNLPIFAPLYMSLGIDPSIFDGMNTLAGDFAEVFESSGGTILSANEFFAALNPEFMIEFAEGLDHNAEYLTMAKEQLNEGEYYESLISARKSLQETVYTGIFNQAMTEDNLLEIFPNPAHQEVHFALNLRESKQVSVTIFNDLGIPVKNLFHGLALPGQLELSWRIAGPGQVYFAEIVMGKTRLLRKIVGI
jgi:hypothetical protein